MTRFVVLASLILASVSQARAQGQITGVVNAATFQSGLPAGGSLATIFCSGLLPTVSLKPGIYVAATSLPLPSQLGGLGVDLNFGTAPVLAVVITPFGSLLNAQINFQVPLERNASLSLNNPAPGSLVACGQVLTELPAQTAWGGFFADSNGYAIAQHASDYSSVTVQNPARAGETIIVYANDFFPVWPPPAIGFPTPTQPLFQAVPGASTVRTGVSYLYLQDYPQLDARKNSYTHTPALQVNFEGLAPGQVGVEQINFVVPANQQPGDWALFFNIGSCPDGRATPGLCGVFGSSSPYVKLPVR